MKLALGASRARLAVEAMVGPIVQCLLVSTAAALAAPWLVEHVGRLLSVRVFAHAGAPLASVPSVVAVAMGGGIGAVAGLAAYLTVDGAQRPGVDVLSTRHVASLPRGVRWLLAVQVTVAIALVSAAVVLVQSVRQAESEALGFRTDGVVVAPTTLPAWRYQDDETRARAAAALLAAVRRETGAPVAVATVLPIGDATPVATVRAAGTEREAGAVLTSVSTEYFQVLGIRVDEGRAFAAADTAGDTEPVVVIDRRLAQALWRDRSPLGRHVDLLGIERRVIGVASSTKQFSLTSNPRPAVYVPFAQAPASSFSLVAALPAAAAGSLSGSLRAVEPDLVVEPVVSMAAVVDSTLEQRRLYSAMSVGISVLAVASAIAGTFGLATLLIGARRRASAIMLAVGASPWRVALSAATPFAVPACVGLAGGVLMTVVLASRLDPFLYRTTTARPDVMAVAGAAVAVVLALGMLGPVWRVVLVNTAEALRLE